MKVPGIVRTEICPKVESFVVGEAGLRPAGRAEEHENARSGMLRVKNLSERAIITIGPVRPLSRRPRR